jgi:hypothetical protein
LRSSALVYSVRVIFTAALIRCLHHAIRHPALIRKSTDLGIHKAQFALGRHDYLW